MPIYNNRMYFGTRNHMQWIAAPKINYDASRRSKFTTAQYTNGGAYVKRSATGARGYNFSWDYKKRDEIRAITDYADGIYGYEQPLYFLDPFAMDKNLLPQFWAAPYLGAYDAPPLLGEGDEERPSVIGTSSNNLGYPSYSAQYIIKDNSVKHEIYLPIPNGYTLWVGVHGSQASGAGIGAYRATGPTTEEATPVDVPFLPEQSSTRVNTSIDGTTYPGVTLRLTGTGTVTISGIIVQVLPNGVTPDTGGYISGQGHSGCSFNSDPVLTEYSAAKDMVGLSVDLMETEGWV